MMRLQQQFGVVAKDGTVEKRGSTFNACRYQSPPAEIDGEVCPLLRQPAAEFIGGGVKLMSLGRVGALLPDQGRAEQRVKLQAQAQDRLCRRKDFQHSQPAAQHPYCFRKRRTGQATSRGLEPMWRRLFG